MIDVYVEVCREDVKLPEYKNKWDSGVDVRAAENAYILPGETMVIPTGLKMAIPAGYEIQVRPRSGISLKTPLRVSNSPGTIDASYRDEIGIIITNTSTTKEYMVYDLETKGNMQGAYDIKKGDRIAQLVLQEVPRINFIITDDVKKFGDNRSGGFGSSGTK
jgi:dUTP pyrophosphatase